MSEMAPGGMEPLGSPAAWGLAGCPQPLEGCSNQERMSTLTPSSAREMFWVCTLTLLIDVGKKKILYMSQTLINVKLLRQIAGTSAKSKQGKEGEYHTQQAHTPPWPLNTEKEKIAAA